MAHAALTIDVYCHRDWDSSPVYRVYVDDDLLTERTWAWPSYETYIKEHIEVEVEHGAHQVKIYNCAPNNNISFKNVTVDGRLLPDSSSQEFQEFTFYV